MNRINRTVPAGRSPYYSNAFNGASFTIGTEATNVITVGVQLKDPNGNNLGVRGHVHVFLSDDSHGDSLTATQADGGIAGGTNGWLTPITTGKMSQGVSESNGTLDVAITHSGVKTYYLGVMMPDGSIVMSGAIAFT
jgi:hypothetical protein